MFQKPEGVRQAAIRGWVWLLPLGPFTASKSCNWQVRHRWSDSAMGRNSSSVSHFGKGAIIPQNSAMLTIFDSAKARFERAARSSFG
jgi:hypothetical protein